MIFPKLRYRILEHKDGGRFRVQYTRFGLFWSTECESDFYMTWKTQEEAREFVNYETQRAWKVVEQIQR